ncbi:MAG: AAA family ATPase [bacterium]|nr:AAA family ATPase [bacterium]
MKILAIRGCNLASLRGDFELDLAAEPFASAGLFAITGPTGAGKSTLLDALCLALFDSTPRLDGRGGAMVGRSDQEETQRLRAGDVRGLLTRGQGSGFAEVDFASRDGRRWQARWEVRRARERADGRLQQQKLTLKDLDCGDRIGDTKTEVLQAIQERIGLSFDQFRRSALLAQGDFAAFLHAAPRERAELLEKVTGTAIYARLSEAAFARAKVEREALEGLARQLANLGLLSPEERQELAQNAAMASAALTAAKQVLKSAETAAQWYVELSKLREREDAGKEAHAKASKQWERARERRVTLDLVKAVQPLRSSVQQQDIATQRRDEERERVADESDRLQDARETMAQAEKKLTEGRAAQERAKQDHETKTPDLEKASLLDDRLGSAEREAEEASTTATTAASHAQEATERSEAAANAVGDEKKKRDASDAWLKKHPDAQALSGAWNHLKAALLEHAEASSAAAETGEKLPKLKDAASQAAEAAKVATTEADTAERKLEECQQVVDHAEAAIPEGRQEQLEAQRKTCERRRDALRSAEAVLAEAQRTQAEQQRAESAVEEARKKQQAALDAVEHTRTALRDHRIRLDEADRALRESRAIRELAERRSDLVDGEPCPLCGSTSHPFQHDGVSSDALAGQQQRLQELKDGGMQLTADLATAREQAKASETEAKDQTKQAALAAGQLPALQRSWVGVLETVRESGPPESVIPDDPLSRKATSTVEDAVSMAEQALDDLTQMEQDFKALAGEAKKGRSVRDTARESRDVCLAARERAEKRERQTSDALARMFRQLDEDHRRRLAALKSLETSLGDRPDWQEQLETDSNAFREARQAEVLEFRQQTTAHEQSSAALAELQPRAAKVAAEVEAARAAATAQEKRRRKLFGALDKLRKERGQVLDGQPVADVKRALERASINAANALDLALDVERETRASLKAAEARLDGARLQLRKETSILEDAQHALQKKLAENEIGLETLRKRLEHDTVWCDTEARTLGAIQQALQVATSVLAERRERRQEHERTDRPEVSEKDATAQKEIAAEGHQKAEEAAQEMWLGIKQDDTARTKADALATEISLQEALSIRWATLNEVIGSHDGHKFRKFAQGLTLDSLLGYANAHLRDLAPRYCLGRVPGEDIELQVIDRDMGDDIRSINSLSGGETFLASLALALGLSSLSASDTPVESLFIDEGFGTLDQETLETALSAFDALQASGHQVGIISHVQDLDQRIGVQLRVVKLGAGRSHIESIGP